MARPARRQLRAALAKSAAEVSSTAVVTTSRSQGGSNHLDASSEGFTSDAIHRVLALHPVASSKDAHDRHKRRTLKLQARPFSNANAMPKLSEKNR